MNRKQQRQVAELLNQEQAQNLPLQRLTIRFQMLLTAWAWKVLPLVQPVTVQNRVLLVQQPVTVQNRALLVQQPVTVRVKMMLFEVLFMKQKKNLAEGERLFKTHLMMHLLKMMQKKTTKMFWQTTQEVMLQAELLRVLLMVEILTKKQRKMQFLLLWQMPKGKNLTLTTTSQNTQFRHLLMARILLFLQLMEQQELLTKKQGNSSTEKFLKMQLLTKSTLQ